MNDDDRIIEILRGHIANAERQLAYMRTGTSFEGVTDPIPEKELELEVLIGKWQGELDRHELRKNAGKHA